MQQIFVCNVRACVFESVKRVHFYSDTMSILTKNRTKKNGCGHRVNRAQGTENVFHFRVSAIVIVAITGFVCIIYRPLHFTPMPVLECRAYSVSGEHLSFFLPFTSETNTPIFPSSTVETLVGYLSVSSQQSHSIFFQAFFFVFFSNAVIIFSARVCAVFV